VGLGRGFGREKGSIRLTWTECTKNPVCGIRKGEYKRGINGGNELSEETIQVRERLKYLPFTLRLGLFQGELGKCGGRLSLSLRNHLSLQSTIPNMFYMLMPWMLVILRPRLNYFMNFCFLNPGTFISAVKA
jgi:hypothetical protein